MGGVVFCGGRNGVGLIGGAIYDVAMAESDGKSQGPSAARRGAEPLGRDALGHRRRRLRVERGEILAETARRAGISPQYLSEMERGLKEPSSEMIAAVAGALDVTLGELTLEVATSLRAAPAHGAPTAYALA